MFWRRTVPKFIDAFLDAFSKRLCYGCSKKYTEGYYCDFCLEGLKFTWTKEGMSRKYLDFDYIELAQILELDLPLYPKIFSTTKYNDMTKDLIRDFKYRKPHLAEFWAKWLYDYWTKHADWILSELKWEQLDKSQHQVVGKVDIYISPVPMHAKKEARREYNQAKLLAEDFANCFEASQHYLMQTKHGLQLLELNSVSLMPAMFERVKETPSLFNKSKFERLEILDGAFALKHDLNLNPENQAVVLLLDDISTTGATFLELFKLMNLDAEIVFLSLCS